MLARQAHTLPAWRQTLTLSMERNHLPREALTKCFRKLSLLRRTDPLQRDRALRKHLTCFSRPTF